MQLFSFLLLLISPVLAYSQCQVSSQFPAGTITPDAAGAVTVISTNQYAGSEYCHITSVLDNHVYEVNHSNGAYITVREGTVGGSVISMGFSTLTFTSTSTSDLYIHFTLDELCSEDATGAFTTTIQDHGTPPCDMSGVGGQHPPSSITPDAGGGLTAISNDQTQGSQFSVITGVGSAHEYTFVHAGGAFVSVTEGATDGPTVGVGPSPLTVQAASNADLFVHWSVDSDCNTDPTGSFATTVQDLGIPACDMSGFGGQYPFTTITPDAGGAVTTIATDQFVGFEYSIIGSILSGHMYEFVHAAGSFVTVREGAIAGPVVGSGFSPLTITTTSTSNLYVHWSADEFCNEVGSLGGFWLTTVQDGGIACPLSAALEPLTDTICDGESTNLTINFSGNNGPVNFQVTNGQGIVSDLGPAITSPFTFPTTEPGNYSILSATDNDCEGSVSGNATVVVHEIPVATLSLVEHECDASDTLYYNFTGTPPWTYTISYFNPGEVPISGTETTSQVPGPHPTVNNGFYVVSNFSDANCPGDSSNIVATAFHDTVKATISGGGLICEGDSIPISIHFQGLGPWDVVINDITAGLTTVTGITQNPYQFYAHEAATYTLNSVFEDPCPGYVFGSAIVLVSPEVTGTISGGGLNCDGNAVNVQVHLTGDPPWEFGIISDPITAYDSVFTNITSSPVTFPVDTSCTLTMTGVQGQHCQGPGSGEVEIQIEEVTAHISGGATICQGESTFLTVSFTGTGPYNFTLNDEFGSVAPFTNVTSNPLTIPVSASGEYGISSVSGALCSEGTGSGIASVIVRPKPTATVSAVNFACDHNDTLFVEFTGTGPWNYTETIYSGTTVWAQSSSQTADNSLVQPTGLLGGYTYQITAVSDAFCEGDSSNTVAFFNRDSVKAHISGGGMICEGDSALVSISFSGAGPWDVVINDLFGNPIPLFEILPSENPVQFWSSDITTYTLGSVYTAPCPGYVSGSATITMPEVTAAISGSGSLCNEDSVQVQIVFTGDPPWRVGIHNQANPENDFFEIPDITSNPYTFYSTSPGTWELFSVSDANCDGEVSGSYSVIGPDMPIPTADFQFEYVEGSQEVQFTYTGSNATSWSWDFGDGDTSNEMSPLHNFAPPGNYNVSLTVTNPCGSDDISMLVPVGPGNDNFQHPIEIFVGTNGPFSNVNATIEIDESAPPAGSGSESCEAYDGWCLEDTEVQNSVWFLHVPDGFDDVGFSGWGAINNLQISVWCESAFFDGVSNALILGGNCLQGANDNDPFDPGNLNSSRLELCGLTPGQPYYVQVDGFQGAEGTFSIDVYRVIEAAFSQVSNGLEVDFSSAPTTNTRPIVDWYWDFGDLTASNNSNPLHTYSNAGTYLACLTVTDSLGCSDTYCDSISVSDLTTSITVGNIADLSIYPNPSNGLLTVEGKNFNGPADILIQDIAGRVVFRKGLNFANKSRLELKLNLAVGSYFVQVYTEKGSVTKQIQIQSNN